MELTILLKLCIILLYYVKERDKTMADSGKRYNSQHYSIYYVNGKSTSSLSSEKLHYDMNLTISYFKRCSGNIKIEGKRYTFNDGDVVLLNTNELHYYSINEAPIYERTTIYIKESILDNFDCENKILFDAFYKRKKGTGNFIESEKVKKHGIDKLFKSILDYTQKGDSISEVLAVCKIIELLAELNNLMIPCEQIEMEYSSENPVIKEVLNFLNENFCEQLTVKDVAEKFYLSKFYLCRLFKENVGISLWDYVIMQRIMYFNELVKENISIEEACYKVGFRNYSNFFRLYKKYMNITPSEFKKQKIR